MAKKLRYNYIFTPSTNTVLLDGYTDAKRLLLITNTKSNIIIYNFADVNATATSVSYNATTDKTTIVLAFNCSAMSSTDTLQIFTEEDAVAFTPSEILQDPVNKFRTSQPQALIDTDFEYGTQITKWENLGMINNRPFAFSSAVGITTINSISIPTSSRTVTIGLSTTAPGIGTAISIQDTYLNIANGNFVVETNSGAGNTIFTYTARATNTTTITDIFDPTKTGIFSGTTYTGAAIGTAPTFVSNTVGSGITVTTTIPHGLALGNEVAVVGSSRTEANGSFVIATINNNTTFTYYSQYAPQANPTGGVVYVRPQGQFLHRPFDGGVIFSSNATSNYETAVRQTRRYFRYQSGKGIQISSGTILKPNLQIDSLTSSGTTVTVQTKEQHNIQAATPGTFITISGANETAYNGTFLITSVTGYNTFQYTALTTPSTTTASGAYICSVNSWYGCANRLGAFDAQNGLFFEFDGQTLYAVRRSSTYQISGKVTATNGSTTISQTNASFPTSFTKQLNVGDYIVLRGQSYRIADIASDTSLTITPGYRGASASYVIVSRTVDTKIPQSTWNLDKCDGTGPSGFNIDLTKMQMFYIDYSWYGAGFARWGFRALNGDVIYVHKLPNNNVNTEAYMRSGNLPARYESESRPPTTYLFNTTLGAADTTVGVASTAGFPTSGTLVVRNSTVYEYMNYTGITTNSFTGLIRGKTGNTSLALTVAASSNVATGSTTNLQIGQRIIGGFPDGTYISGIGIGSITASQAATSTNPTVVVPPMGATSGQVFTYSATDPIAIELAYPTYGPTISHWGTSVIMDGRFDDDKSLIFTYGQTGTTTISSGQSRALFSIRVAPSIDNGVTAVFGARELINRMQLKLVALDVSVVGVTTGTLLVRAYLNGVPSTATTWTNAVGNVANIANSSLAQIADYSGGSATVSGGEVTAGFFVGSGANSIDLTQVRDLGNSILGGGGPTADRQIYPDGPDTLTIVATNLSAAAANVAGRLSWTEAQA
jgi:hypothetical protein